jgi:hypothetical protein
MKDRFPVSVVVERRSYPGKPWMIDSWSVVGILPIEGDAGVAGCKSIYRDEEKEQFLYEGHVVELFADEAESYYTNLTATKPAIFVIGAEDEDGDNLKPLLVTLSYSEMSSYVEVDTPVFDLPIPQPIYEWVEAWVLENYLPEKKHKRARQPWADNSWKPLRRPVDQQG